MKLELLYFIFHFFIFISNIGLISNDNGNIMSRNENEINTNYKENILSENLLFNEDFSINNIKGKFLQVSSSYIANMCLNLNPICGSSPVCAFKFCDNEICFESKNNNCKACQEYNAEYYVNGICDNIENKTVFIKCGSTINSSSINNNGNNDCSNLGFKKGVCGKFKTSSICENEKCTKKFKNSCLACMDERIDSFYYGECKSVYIANILKTNLKSFLVIIILILLSF